jgi:hypothetical protein
VGAKIVLGILIGLAFHFAGALFSHMGMLNDWPALVSAGLPVLIVTRWRASRSARARCADARPGAVPARRSCRNWRSRSTSAHAKPRPSAAKPERAST